MTNTEFVIGNRMKFNLSIFQHLSGFIANSSGAAFFQFAFIKSKRFSTEEDLIESFGIKPGSIAHEVMKNLVIYKEFLRNRITRINNEKYFFYFSDENNDEKNKLLFNKMGIINNDFYKATFGFDIESFEYDYDEIVGTGLINLLKEFQSKKSKTQVIITGNSGSGPSIDWIIFDNDEYKEFSVDNR